MRRIGINSWEQVQVLKIQKWHLKENSSGSFNHFSWTQKTEKKKEVPFLSLHLDLNGLEREYAVFGVDSCKTRQIQKTA